MDKCILVSVWTPRKDMLVVEEHLAELAELSASVGIEVVDTVIQKMTRLDPGTYIGRGKITQIAELALTNDVTHLIFDEDLSPGQVQNLEEMSDLIVLDRTNVILDIFAQRARTREAKVQVELAQLRYLLPKLSGVWTHLERQKGGIGLRGPGETQLETDRRLVRTRIRVLRSELEKISRVRDTQSRRREQQLHVSLIGYTNAGKSTLLNAITGARAVVMDQLFATLDPFTRSHHLSGIGNVLFTDTVGFIRKLPHHLVASFRSTMEQTLQADLLLNVIDLSNPRYNDHILTVDKLLNEMDVSQDHVVKVFNKIDQCTAGERKFRDLAESYPGSLFVSARRGLNLSSLRERVVERFRSRFSDFQFTVDHNSTGAIAFAHSECMILNTEEIDDDIVLRVRIANDRVQANLAVISQKYPAVLVEAVESKQAADTGDLK
jgi:GTPase